MKYTYYVGFNGNDGYFYRLVKCSNKALALRLKDINQRAYGVVLEIRRYQGRRKVYTNEHYEIIE